MSLYNPTPFTNLTPGTAVQPSDIYSAVDTTDKTQSPAGSSKRYSILQLQNYIASQIAGVGVSSCLVASDAPLTAIYDNGVSGVGAVLINAATQAALIINGVTLEVADRVLIKDQTSSMQNGVYVVTDIGSNITNWILTRATDYNGATRSPSFGDFVGVISGTINPLSFYFQISANPIIVGTTNIIFEREGAVSGGFTWNSLSETSVTATPNSGYIINNSALSSVLLPAIAPVGTVIAIQGKGAGGWMIQAGSGQFIHLGNTPTSFGGTLTSNSRYDNVQVVCITANTEWVVSYTFSAGLIIT